MGGESPDPAFAMPLIGPAESSPYRGGRSGFGGSPAARTPGGVASSGEVSALLGAPVGPKLARTLGMTDVYCMIVCVLVNSVFISPVIVQQGSLLSALVILGIAGAITLACVVVYTELAAFLPSAGGDYEYIRVAFGSRPAFAYAWTMLVFLQSCTTALEALAFSSLMYCDMMPSLRHHDGECTTSEGVAIHDYRVKGIAIVAVLAATAFNCLDVRRVAGAQRLFALMKFAVVALVFGACVRYAWGAPDRLRASLRFDWSVFRFQNLHHVITALLWSVDGFNSIVCLSEEMRHPKVQMGRALFYGVITILAMYALLVVSYFCVLDPAIVVQRGKGVAMQAMAVAAGERWGAAISVLVALSALATINGYIMTGGRWLYAAARNGHFPRVLTSLGARSRAPYAAVIVQGVWPAACLAFQGPSFDDLLSFFGINAWLFYFVVAMAFLKFQATVDNQTWTRRRTASLAAAGVVLVCCAIMLLLSVYNSPFITLLSFTFLLSSIPAQHMLSHAD